MSYPPPPDGESSGREPGDGQQPPYGQPGYGYDPNQPPYGYGQPPGYGPAPYGYGGAGGYGVEYASWLYRVGGYLVDQVVMLPGYVLYGVGAAFVDSQGNQTGTGAALTGLGALVTLAILVWNVVFRQGRSGWSVGKQVVGIRLLSERTGQPIGAGMSFLRQLAHILDSLACYIGWLWPLWDRKRQTFADKLLSSVVLMQRKPDAQPTYPTPY